MAQKEIEFESNIFEIDAAEKKDDESSNSLSERAHLLGNKDGEISARSSSRISYRFTGDLSKFKKIPRLYSELEELVYHEGDDPMGMHSLFNYEWKVRSRWIKYEQTVNRITNKWDEPYLGPLLYQELIYLKNNLQTGTIILNCRYDNIEALIDEVVGDFVNRGQMYADKKQLLKQIILTQYRSQRAFAGVLTGRKGREPDKLPSTKGNSRLITAEELVEDIKGDGSPNKKSTDENKNKAQNIDGHIFYIGAESVSDGLETIENKDFQNKIENLKNCYAHNIETKTSDEIFEVESFLIMTGEVEFLERNVIAFVRLMGDNFVYDVGGFRMKIRFLFIFLGPKSKVSFLEIGRCFGSLMNNKTFKASAYRAKSGHDLIKAIKHYSNQSLCIVLPNGDYHKDLLSPMTDWVQKNMQKDKKRGGKNLETIRNNSSLPSTVNTSCAKEESDSDRSCSDNENCKKNKAKKNNPFEPTGSSFGSLFNEAKHRYRQYWSDIRDGLNFQSLIAAVFTFTICLAPTLTFGGILAVKTQDWFGVNEMLIAVASNGLFFALFSGQPIMIFGATGPLLVFEEMIYIVCTKTLNIDFLVIRIWVACWILIISLIVLKFEWVRVIHHVTRFTEEIFAFVIALAFILDVCKKCVKYFIYDPLYTTNQYCSVMQRNINYSLETCNQLTNVSTTPEIDDCTQYYYSDHLYPEANIALVSIILLFCTFFLAYTFLMIRRSSFFSSELRRTVSDLGILFTITLMVLVDYAIRNRTNITTQKLDVPDDLIPTRLNRTEWFVSPFGQDIETFQWWIPFLAFVPGLLIFIILFFEVELIGILLTNKHRKMKKGTGFNLDLLIGALMMLANSFFGLPWLCAAPVRTLAHWASLTTYSQSNIPGEKNILVYVREQRITGIIVHVAIGFCLLAKDLLRLIPVPVLYGLLFYFGIVSLSGTQLYERVLYLFTPLKNTPNWSYARGIRVIKRNIFTLIQIVSVCVLLVFKSVALVSFLFPVFLLILVLLRKFVLPKFYSDRELEQLDDEEEQIEDSDNIHDCYDLTHLPL